MKAIFILLLSLLIVLPVNTIGKDKKKNKIIYDYRNKDEVLFWLDEYDRKTGYKPKDGFVPNAETAIKIAEAVWLPIYGNNIYKRKPFRAKLRNNSYWDVRGTVPKGVIGGAPAAHIRKIDGKILFVIHDK